MNLLYTEKFEIIYNHFPNNIFIFIPNVNLYIIEYFLK